MLKILQARLQQYVNQELPDVQVGLRKGRETRDQVANISWIIEKTREFQKNISLCFTDYVKPFDWVNQINCGKFLKIWEYQTTLPEKPICRSVQFSSVAQSCPTLCDPMECSTPGLPVHHQLQEFTQTHVLWVDDAIQPSHPQSPPFPLTFKLSQHQSLFKEVSSLHQIAKVLKFQLQHQSFQWLFRIDFL